MSTRIFSRPLTSIKWNKITSFKFMSSSTVPQEEKVKVGKYNINYLKVGTGPHNLLCLPSTFGTIWTDFKLQVEGIDRNKFTLIVCDTPGHGKSRPPEKELDFHYLERDADCSYQFMKALNIETYSLLGWSAGGTTAMIHAAKYSEAVRKLVVWGTSSFVRRYDYENYKRLRYLNNWSKKSLQGMIDTYGEEKFAKYASEWCDHIIRVYYKRNGNLCLDFLPNIKCPTYILHGKKDPLIDQEHLQHLHANITGSRFHLYPEGKHNIHIAYAEDFNKRVQEFLLLG